MNTDPRTSLCRIIPVLLEEGILRESGCLSVRSEGSLYITPLEKDLPSLREEDILKYGEEAAAGEADHPELPLHRILYKTRSDIHALIHAASPAVTASSRAGVTVYPLLDDMAQIVGTSIRTAPSGRDRQSLNRAVRAFRKRNAFFIKDGGALCGSGTLDDAHAVCQVGEKACKAFIESSFIGGGHRINPVEAWLMRTVYLKKYSKQTTKNR